MPLCCTGHGCRRQEGASDWRPVTVVPDRAWVSFMWSYPNLIPLDEATIADIVTRLERFTFERVYGGWWGRVVIRDAAGAVRRSADRYVARLRGQRPGDEGADL